MNLKNRKTCVELRSENPLEAQSLLRASMFSFSPRSACIMPNNDRMVVLTRDEIPEFMTGVIRAVDVHPRDKWAMTKLLSEYLLGNIKDEAIA